MEKSEKRTLVVAILLPIVILVSVSVSNATVNQQIQASVTVYPSAKIYCDPDILTAGSSVQWINCFIELDGADVRDINPANIFLNVIGKSGSIQADTSFKQFGDFNNNGITEIMLRFSRASADSNWFNSITQNTQFTFNLTGTVKGFPFSGTSPILVVKNPSSSATYYQLNAPNIGSAKINWLYGPSWFDYKIYTPDFLYFSGFYYNIPGSALYGTSSFYSQGYIKVEKTYRFGPFEWKVTEKQPITISVIMKDENDCYANPTTKDVHCEGSALLMINKDRTGEQHVANLKSFRFDIKGYKATLEGGNVWNEVIRVSDITMTRIIIS